MINFDFYTGEVMGRFFIREYGEPFDELAEFIALEGPFRQPSELEDFRTPPGKGPAFRFEAGCGCCFAYCPPIRAY